MSRIQERDTNSLYPGALDWRSSINWVCPMSHTLGQCSSYFEGNYTCFYSSGPSWNNLCSSPTTALLLILQNPPSPPPLEYDATSSELPQHGSTSLLSPLSYFLVSYLPMWRFFFISSVKIFNVKINKNPNNTRGNEIKSKINSLFQPNVSPQRQTSSTVSVNPSRCFQSHYGEMS